MVVRPAHSDEGERLREITAAAKGYWGYDPVRVRAWAAALDLSPDRLASAHAFVAEEGGGAIGWAEILPPEAGVCVLEHLWVEPVRIRRGVGSQLFRHGVGGGAERPRLLRAHGWPLAAHDHLRVGSRALDHGHSAPSVIQATSRTPLDG
jgi:GNAT superfamily N-acetyltransferase